MNWRDNMDKVYIGKIVSTHGIKGELKILSDFDYKSKVFVVGKKIIIDDDILLNSTLGKETIVSCGEKIGIRYQK